MAPLPYWDNLKYDYDCNQAQRISFAVFTYFSIMAFLGLFFFAFCNYLNYVNKKPRTCSSLLIPLSLFYILALITIALRILTLILWLQLDNIQGSITIKMLPPLFKLNVGLVQAWILIELSI